ncbi:circadian clock protein KaiA [Chamaesiphon sp. VAR_48_metabat_135_sub]|uniref:circadian clock protein KaiA n=1 Tax=Chamaesiphon sp. VAR_48_metabat_135_sub TaxID=2964699 RepID=UPI00286A3893|nr:circadian clock protein KaiA [Chamaesiphon sp. VAR_48_metabat_135_sub]
MAGLLTIAVLADSTDLFPLLGQYLDGDRYVLQYFTSQSEFLAHVEMVKHELDCLVFDAREQLLPVINYLYDRGLILPVVIIHRLEPNHPLSSETNPTTHLSVSSSYIYQPSEVILAITEMSDIGVAIDKAIAKFLNLAPIMPASEDSQPTKLEIDISQPTFLLQQQSRLAQKLNERLGYLAVYYKRNSRQFFRHLDRQEKQELLDLLKSQYRQIVLNYFADSSQINDNIDEFVSAIFFRDLAVSEIVKIHMELMEEFSDQLKLEGRSEEILLDYRLTLIDIIAHLCEMYRRSIPREVQ